VEPTASRTFGYTLVEVLITVAILAIIVAVAVPAYTSYLERGDASRAATDITRISLDLERHFAGNGQYPPDLATLGVPIEEPWGNPYRYLNMALESGSGAKRKDHNLVPINTDYDLYSMGPDGLSAAPLTAKRSRDDIIRANNGEYIGPAADY